MWVERTYSICNNTVCQLQQFNEFSEESGRGVGCNQNSRTWAGTSQSDYMVQQLPTDTKGEKTMLERPLKQQDMKHHLGVNGAFYSLIFIFFASYPQVNMKITMILRFTDFQWQGYFLPNFPQHLESKKLFFLFFLSAIAAYMSVSI